jgi:hypothetical protein
MRTTLDIDDDILQAAKELARAENKTAGQVLSDLARNGLMAGNSPTAAEGEDPFVIKDGLPILRSRGGIVTNEMIRKIQEEIDQEDARLAGCELPARAAG